MFYHWIKPVPVSQDKLDIWLYEFSILDELHSYYSNINVLLTDWVHMILLVLNDDILFEYV